MNSHFFVGLFFPLILLTTTPCYAEILDGFPPYATLQAIRKAYPKAKYKETERPGAGRSVWEISGPTGLRGTVIVYFMDFRESAEKNYKLAVSQKVMNKAKVAFLKAQKGDAALVLATTFYPVRWVPDFPLTKDRLISRYGTIYDSSVDNRFLTVLNWKSVGVEAVLDEDEDSVVYLDYSPTEIEVNNYSSKKNKD